MHLDDTCSKTLVYKKDYYVLQVSILCAIILPCALVLGSIFCDAMVRPIQVLLGANAEEIRRSSNLTFFQSMGWYILLMPVVMFSWMYVILGFLEHGFRDGFFVIPYERDIYGKKKLPK